MTDRIERMINQFSNSLDTVLTGIDGAQKRSLERLFDLLRIPSVSTDPAFQDDCQRAAEWLARDLADLGFEARVAPTAGQPMVVAHWRPRSGTPQGPHVLFYGHYDVQPADPENLWTSPAFEPVLTQGASGRQEIRARGASDDKGQLMTFIEACRAWISATGDLPVPVTILLEGEEESGSANLDPFLKQYAEELRADVALICDTGMWDTRTPAVTTMLRGMLAEEITVRGPARDLHSGLYGGAALNPIHVLGRIVAALHGPDGRIQIPGFYDGVAETPDALKTQWAKLGQTAQDFLGPVGLTQAAGEAGRSHLEQVWTRPTCDVNGIVGGYTKDGFKTLIPAEASAKISFRLVSEQDPHAIQEAFRAFVRAHLPADCTVNFHKHGASPALAVDTDNPHLDKVCAALTQEFGTETALIGCGGSIPVVGSMKRLLGMDSLLVGFALDDDRIHSPNEKYDVASFHRGTRSWARILEALSN